MNTKQIEALKLALEALEIVNREMLTLRDELAERGGRPSQGYHQLLWDSSHKVYTDTAIPAAEAIREALAQPEQEPVASESYDMIDRFLRNNLHDDDYAEYLTALDAIYTTPPQRKPLTDEQKLMCWSRATCDADVEHKTEHQCLMDYGAEIEAAHGIKE